MNIEKIVSFLQECIKKILDKPLKGSELMVAYAFEFQLILVGERVNVGLEEIEKYTFNHKDLFIKLLNQTSTEFDAAKISSTKDRDYNKGLFRQAFNKTIVGSNLMLLNTLRNQLKHRFTILSPEDHKKFRTLYFQAHEIQNFLQQVSKFFNKEKEPEYIIETLFTNKDIKPLTFTVIEDLKALFEEKKKKVNELSFEEQKNKVLKKLNRLQEFNQLLTDFNVKLNEEHQKTAKAQDKDVSPLHATAMCLTVIGEIATTLIQIQKNEKRYNKIIRDIFNEYDTTLIALSDTSRFLTHQTSALPAFPPMIKTYQNNLKYILSLKDLTHKIDALNSPPEVVQTSSMINVTQKSQEETAITSYSVVELMSRAASPIIAASEETKEDKSESQKRKLAEISTETSKEKPQEPPDSDEPPAKKQHI